MCEIMAVPGSGINVDSYLNACGSMYKTNNDGLGIVAVHADTDGFNYEVYKAETPDWGKVRTFMDERDPWRFIIHARLATAGGTGDRETHPIYVQDDDVDIDWVVHNGHVQSRSLRKTLIQKGHDFGTKVDTEVIPHAHGEIPDTLDEFDEPKIYGTLNYLLFSDDRILIRNTGKYHLGDDMQMTCRNEVLDDAQKRSGFFLFYPDGSYEQTDAVDSGSFSRSGSANLSGSGWGRKKYTRPAKNKNSSDSDDSDSGNVDGEAETRIASSTRYDSGSFNTTSNYRGDPHYWRDMEGEHMFCSMHREAFKEDEECMKCAEHAAPGDISDETYQKAYRDNTFL